ncbi:MAG: hypothetical protein HYZ73_06375 [Elusimicrobia bacterium]|nr:hypothetical protein [Elusimicrobiota bacterium]
MLRVMVRGGVIEGGGMGRSMEAKKNVKKKAARSMKEKRQAKRDRKSRWSTAP